MADKVAAKSAELEKKISENPTSAKLVNFVNPKFFKFDRPVFIAINVLIPTLFLSFLIFLSMKVASTTEVVSIMGPAYVHDEFLELQRQAGGTTCISYMRAFYALHGAGVPTRDEEVTNIDNVNCIPNRGWLDHGDFEWNEFLGGEREPREKLEICDEETFWEREEGYCSRNKQNECHQCFKHGGINPTFAAYKRTTYKSVGECLGLALAYAAYVETVITLIVILWYMKTGQIKVKDGEQYGGLSDVLNESTVKDKETALNNQLKSMQDALDKLQAQGGDAEAAPTAESVGAKV